MDKLIRLDDAIRSVEANQFLDTFEKVQVLAILRKVPTVEVAEMADKKKTICAGVNEKALIYAGDARRAILTAETFEVEYHGVKNRVMLPCVAEALIKGIPVVDAVPVVHGQWIGPTRVDANHNKYECSECGFWGVPGWVACPSCGAKMDERINK